jgi:superfamily II DNA/RNA helicase
MEQNGSQNTETISSFDDMDLKKPILRGIYAHGFEKPSAIQKSAIVPMTTGRDIIAQAQSGTGKTGTFSIGVLQMIDENNPEEQALILSPTRELSRQTYNVIKSLGQYTDITIKELIGGQFGNKNISKNNKPANIVVGTPGKVLSELSHNRINYETIKLLVLDEADEMLSKGFTEQIQEIFRYLSKDAQIALFSATMSNEILEITEEFMNDPYKILVKTDELTLEGIQQYRVDVIKESFKYETLCDLYSTIAITQCIIYCNTRKKVYYLSNKLRENDFTVSCIYGDMQQAERNRVMESFRTGETRILITTDILARGIDVQQVSLVINYDVPNEVETYIHRIGRSGRMGRKGTAITFSTDYDVDKLSYIEKYYNTKVYELPVNIASIIT